MESEKLAPRRRREALHLHLHLPPELLSLISSFLEDAADVIRFRSVCRSWRMSTPPPLHKISPFFPVVIPAESDADDSSSDWSDTEEYAETEIQASAIYLLRPRRDPTKAWVVHAQETAPGKLIFRHALTLKEIPVRNWPDLSSSDEWSSVTQIARTYNSFSCCSECKGVEFVVKFALIVSNSPGSNQLFRAEQTTDTPSARGTPSVISRDFVQFNGQIYTTRSDATLYRVDHTTSPPRFIQLIRGGEIWRKRLLWRRLVVLDGHLYIVVASSEFVECYRLIEEGGRWERVEDLGGGVLFVNKHSTFALSARDLPHPWRGNCIVYLRTSRLACLCSSYDWEIRVFDLRSEQLATILSSDGDVPPSFFRGYSDLFESPLTRS